MWWVFQCFLNFFEWTFFLEDLCVHAEPSKICWKKRPHSYPEKTKSLPLRIQVLAAALISSLSFVGLGLAGAKQKQRESWANYSDQPAGWENPKLWWLGPGIPPKSPSGLGIIVICPDEKLEDWKTQVGFILNFGAGNSFHPSQSPWLFGGSSHL